MTHVFVWTFKDLVGATLLGMVVLGFVVYGLLVLYDKVRRVIKRRSK